MFDLEVPASDKKCRYLVGSVGVNYVSTGISQLVFLELPFGGHFFSLRELDFRIGFFVF